MEFKDTRVPPTKCPNCDAESGVELMAADFEVVFIPSGRGKARCPPDPNFPNGIRLDLATPGAPVCTIRLPYPAPECGGFRATCKRCGFGAFITAAGRPDDPVEVTFACRAKTEAN